MLFLLAPQLVVTPIFKVLMHLHYAVLFVTMLVLPAQRCSSQPRPACSRPFRSPLKPKSHQLPVKRLLLMLAMGTVHSSAGDPTQGLTVTTPASSAGPARLAQCLLHMPVCFIFFFIFVRGLRLVVFGAPSRLCWGCRLAGLGGLCKVGARASLMLCEVMCSFAGHSVF